MLSSNEALKELSLIIMCNVHLKNTSLLHTASNLALF